MTKIDSFDGEYDFLSNFYPCKVEWEGRIYQSSEGAYQSAKCVNENEKDMFTSIPANQTKKLGRKVDLREDWDKVKEDIMYDIVYAKFTQNKELADKLINTGTVELVEGNYWGDTYWGVCNGMGQNKLGKILMKIRSELVESLNALF